MNVTVQKYLLQVLGIILHSISIVLVSHYISGGYKEKLIVGILGILIYGGVFEAKGKLTPLYTRVVDKLMGGKEGQEDLVKSKLIQKVSIIVAIVILVTIWVMLLSPKVSIGLYGYSIGLLLIPATLGLIVKK